MEKYFLTSANTKGSFWLSPKSQRQSINLSLKSPDRGKITSEEKNRVFLLSEIK